MKNLAAGRCFRTRRKGQGRKSVTPLRLAIDATVEEKSREAGRPFVGFYEGKKLKFAGRVGTGFSEKLIACRELAQPMRVTVKTRSYGLDSHSEAFDGSPTTK
jgi:hypothetical protein